MSDREEFEKWAAKYFDIRNFTLHDDGDYLLDRVANMYSAWQAARAKVGEAIAEAYMQGQIDAGMDPSYSTAKAYASARKAPASGEAVAFMVEWDDGLVDLVEGPLPEFGEDPMTITPLFAHPPAKVPEGIPPEVSEADLFWDANDMENGMRDPQELADHCGGDLQQGETMIVDVLMAKELPIRHMKIWVDSDDMIDYELTDQPPQEQ